MIALIVIAAVFLVLAIWFFSLYNRLVSLGVAADEGESEIDVQLKRRHDLIPNLVESVKGYASHERGTFEQVTNARAAALEASGVAAQGAAEGELSQALGRLFAVAEAYPDLKANQNFLQLQGELTATEDRLQAARRFYNTTVKALNTACVTIPSKFVVPLAKVTEREFFELDSPAEAAVPQVSFGS
jgi:LemA protein